MEMQITEEFKKYIKPFRGTVGNPKGPFWFCAIEPGKGGIPIDFSPLQNPVAGRTGYYNKKAGKIVRATANKDLKNIDTQVGEQLFSESGCAFKMNLYPFPFEDIDLKRWSKEHFEKTGISCKVVYQAYCIQHRFPYLKNLVEIYKPKVLLCTSKGDAWAFKLAFLGEERYFDELEEIKLTPNGGQSFEVSYFLIGETSVFLTNYLGYQKHSLNSDFQYCELGKLIRSKCDIAELLIECGKKPKS
jgi:hypothetical protein